MFVGGAGTLTNAGTIAGTNENGSSPGIAVEFAAGGTVTNQSTGLIQGYYHGVKIETNPGTVSNAGTIEATRTAFGVRSTAIYLTSGGTVGNTGRLLANAGTDTDGYGVLINGTSGGTGGYVTNSGTIAGNFSGVNILAAGMVTNQSNALIEGYFAVGLGVGTVLNAGTIIATGTSGIFADGISLGSGSVDNTGFIQSNARAVYVYARGTVTNSATVVGSVVVGSPSRADGQLGGSIDNSGTITGYAAIRSNTAVLGSTPGTLTNEGWIGRNAVANAVINASSGYIGQGIEAQTAVNLGTVMGGVDLTSGGTLDNSALVQGDASGVRAYGTAVYTVINSGTIAATGGNSREGAVFLQNATITNEASGVIQHYFNGINLYSGVIGNAGLIEGTGSGGYYRATRAADGIYTGYIHRSLAWHHGYAPAYIINGAAATISNSGTIVTLGTNVAGGRGIDLAVGGTLDNTGLAQGYNAGIYADLTNRPGVYFYGTIVPSAIVNSATIAATGTAGVGVWLNVAGSTVVDSGTISGASGTAIYFGTLGGTGGNRLVLEHGYTLTGGVVIAGTGSNTLELAGTAGAVTVDFNAIGEGFTNFSTVAFGAPSGNNEILKIDDTAELPGTVAGFTQLHDIVDVAMLAGNPVVNFDTASDRLTLTADNGSVTFQLDNEDYTGVVWQPAPDGAVGTDIVIACFCRGTLIETPAGEMAVEDLQIGDRVVTLSGEMRPIRWIGRRAYDGRFIAGNRDALPIRIKADALAEGLPAQDLYVSPAHALYIDGVLVHAEHLVNGATIVQVEAVEAIEYFHIELDSHDLLLANGTPAETYVDCDNRLMFANGAEYAALYPYDARPAWAFCAPRLAWDDAELNEIRAMLLWRATALGYDVDGDPGLHLIVDGHAVRPQTASDCQYTFDVPNGAREVLLVSRTSVPAEIDAGSRDLRRLGVPLHRLVLRQGEAAIEIGHSDAALGDGFYDAEATHRWTDGRARLPAGLLDRFRGPFNLEVYLTGSGLRYRTASAAPSAAAA